MLKKRLTAVLVLCLFVIACLSVYSPNISAQTQTVLNVPSNQYPTIQSAFNAASNGSTINIAAGTYNENPKTVVWTNGVLQTFSDITIQGTKDTVINGDVFFGPFSNVKVDSLTITGKLTVGNAMESAVQNCAFTNIKAKTLWSYTTTSVFSNLQVTDNMDLSGSNNILTGSILNHLRIGGNGPGATTTQNRIENNQIAGGIDASAALKATIVGNTIDGATVGITEMPSVPTRYGTGDLTITNNTIQNCAMGIYLNSAASVYRLPDTVTENILKNNDVGIAIQFGTFPLPNSNIIYRNNFVNNKLQVNCMGEQRADVWSYGTPPNGNYWSDYTGTDQNGDGIGDSPYIINSVNNDTCPLMTPYPPSTDPTPTPTATASPTPQPQNTQTPTNSPNQNSDPTQTPTPTPTGTMNPTGANSVPETNASYPLIALLATAIALGAVATARKHQSHSLTTKA